MSTPPPGRIGGPVPIPDAPGTITIQLQQLSAGQRRAVLVTPNGDIPDVPQGMKTIKTDDGTFIYNPALTSARGIRRAGAQGQLNRVLGPTQGGMGPQSKEEIIASGQPPVSVVGKDAEGKVAQATLTTPDQAQEATAQTQLVTPPGGKVETQSPEQTIEERAQSLAADGIELNRGSSTKVPLSPLGHQQAQQLATESAARGGFDKIETSDSVRGRETTQPIAALNPKRAPVVTNQNLESWGQGVLESQPADTVKPEIDRLQANPEEVPPGKGPLTDRPGESRNQFHSRIFSEVQKNMLTLANNPNQRILMMTHSQGAKEIFGWVKAGMPDDFSVDEAATKESAESPASVQRLYPNPKTGQWEMTAGDNGGPGIYIGRHAMTPMNKENYRGGASKSKTRNFLGDNPVSKHLDMLRSADDDSIDSAIQSFTSTMAQTFDRLPEHHQDTTLREIQRLPRRTQLAILGAIQHS